MKDEGLNPTSNTYTAYIVKKIKKNGQRKICILQGRANYCDIL